MEAVAAVVAVDERVSVGEEVSEAYVDWVAGDEVAGLQDILNLTALVAYFHHRAT